MQPSTASQLRKASRGIAGWFEATGLFALIDEVQQTEGVRGDLFEIGAHHGKSAVVLGNMARAGERVGICDIFGAQSENISGSGSGDRATLEANMQALAPHAQLQVFERLSNDLSGCDVGHARFFHIDGGHLFAETMNDLLLGDATVVAGGAIVVDDPFRPEWPGVTEAIMQFLHDRPEWFTVMIGLNKLLLARRDLIQPYRDAVQGDQAWEFIDRRVWDRKTLPVAGTDATIFYVPAYRQVAGLTAAVARTRWFVAAARRHLAR